MRVSLCRNRRWPHIWRPPAAGQANCACIDSTGSGDPQAIRQEGKGDPFCAWLEQSIQT
ncbi:MAG TPA: hypothetical protein PL105_13485 [Caldilineaceae bacterium]|nr:hypothetical protein [Caldilineaceae bacterium]